MDLDPANVEDRNAALNAVYARLNADTEANGTDWTIEQRAAYAGLTVEQVRRLEP